MRGVGRGEPVSCTPQEHAPPLAGARRKRGADWLGGSRGFQPPRRRARGAETQFKRRSGGSWGAGAAVSSALHPSPRTQIRHGRYWFGALFPLLLPAPEKPRTGLGRLLIGGVLRQLLRTLCRGLAPSRDTEPPKNGGSLAFHRILVPKGKRETRQTMDQGAQEVKSPGFANASFVWNLGKARLPQPKVSILLQFVTKLHFLSLPYASYPFTKRFGFNSSLRLKTNPFVFLLSRLG